MRRGLVGGERPDLEPVPAARTRWVWLLLNDQAQPDAVVYLQDQKNLEVKTYITEADGHYRFGSLNSDVDYQLWAEYKGHKSKTRSISSFDGRKQFTFDLKIDPSK